MRTLITTLAVLGAVSLAAPAAATPEASLAKCQSKVSKEGARYVKSRTKAIDKCLKRVAAEVVANSSADLAKAGRKCVKALRKLGDSRPEKNDAEDKLRAKLTAKCDPATREHSLADLLGPGATVAEPLAAESLGEYCASFGGDGVIDSLGEWVDCVVAAHDCQASQSVAVRVPRAVEWLALIRGEMLLAEPKDPAQVTDAVAVLDAVDASMDADGDEAADLSCGPPTCPSYLLECSDLCVDPDTDESHCGGCGAICGPGTTCTGGLCL